MSAIVVIAVLTRKTALKEITARQRLKIGTRGFPFQEKVEEKRAECLGRITSDYGTQLRMNRSIQAEGSFANVKEDMKFRRYLYRGKESVLAQSILLAIGYDINKLHHKIASERTGTHLFELKRAS